MTVSSCRNWFLALRLRQTWVAVAAFVALASVLASSCEINISLLRREYVILVRCIFSLGMSKGSTSDRLPSVALVPPHECTAVCSAGTAFPAAFGLFHVTLASSGTNSNKPILQLFKLVIFGAKQAEVLGAKCNFGLTRSTSSAADHPGVLRLLVLLNTI